MPVRVGILCSAHLHVWSYAAALSASPSASFIGLWDDDAERRTGFAAKSGVAVYQDMDSLLDAVDAVVITSENSRHAELAERAARQGKHILCEKPLVISEEEGRRMFKAVDQAKVKLMTAFPCRFSPAYTRVKQRVKDGEVGKIRAICATNQGRCPFGWFVEPKKSGGGAMIDHVVHVTDILRDLLGEEVQWVYAYKGNNMYGKDWEDTAMLNLRFGSGVFASLDSSWSRPTSYKTWGNVNMQVVGESGVLEMQMFSQVLDMYSNESNFHSQVGYGSNADALMVEEFLASILEDRQPAVTGWDGLQAARVALAGYESVKAGAPIPVSSQAPV